MWPPSSGSSGTKLNMPMKKLKPAISISSDDELVLDRELLAATRPRRPTGRRRRC